MTEAPGNVRALLEEREGARAARDFATADRLRAEIEAHGWLVRDRPEGPTLERAPMFETVAPASVPSTLSDPPTLEVSFHVLYEGFRSDLERFVAALGAHDDLSSAEIVIVDNASEDGDLIEGVAQSLGQARALHLDAPVGWAAARNAGIKGARGAVIVLVDLSIEPSGPIVDRLLEVFADPRVGVAGPFGLVSDDMRAWRESEGPEVDAVEGYLMAIRREALVPALIHERFKWYRNADIDLSFQVRAQGYEARVVALPVARHTHRGWTSVDEHERARLSKRNHYVFFDRWKGRQDLLVTRRR